jgi:hypothetical protein
MVKQPPNQTGGVGWVVGTPRNCIPAKLAPVEPCMPPSRYDLITTANTTHTSRRPPRTYYVLQPQVYTASDQYPAHATATGYRHPGLDTQEHHTWVHRSLVSSSGCCIVAGNMLGPIRG